MHRIFTMLFFFSLLSLTVKAQCVIDTNHFTGTKYTYPDTLPCAFKGLYYDTTVQVKVPSNVYADEIVPSYPHFQIRVDSVRIDSITDLPDSLNWSMTPATKKIYAPGYGCFGVFGKAVADTGTYNVGVWGVVWFNAFGKDTFQKGDFSAVFPVKIRVIEQGTPCYGKMTAINDPSAEAIAVFPVPFSAAVNVVIEGHEIQSVALFDHLGRKIDAIESTHFSACKLQLQGALQSGHYFVRVTTNKGVYFKHINSIQE